MLGLAYFNNFAILHHTDLVCYLFDDAEVMGNQQHSHAGLLLEFFQQSENLFLNGYVKRCGRFIGNQ